MRIGLVLSVLDEEYQISVYEGIKRKAEEFGFELVCFQLENSLLYSDSVISKISDASLFAVDCVILLTSVISENYVIKSREDIKKIWGQIPVVSIGQEVSGVPSLLVKTEDSIKKLVEHMVVHHGYRHFLYIGGSSNQQDAIIREKIFTDCMHAYSKIYPDLAYTIENASFTELSAIDAMKAFFEDNVDADIEAVMCANDNMAIGVYKFLKINKDTLKLHDIAVTGFDDIPQSRFSNPSITTVSQSLKQLGEQAVEVIRKICNGEVVENHFVGSEVIFRESCGCHDSEKENNLKSFFNQLQKMYIRSESMQRQVTRLGQQLNFAQDIGGLRYVMKNIVVDFETNNFSVIRFAKKKKDEILVEPMYVFSKGEDCSNDYDGKVLPLGLFYKSIITGNSLIFKYLNSGDELVGAIIYDVSTKVLPYINSISINIAQAIVRIQVLEERQRYAQKLEKDVAVRTAEVVEANRKRLEVEGQVLKISEMERQRFSNDLHDDICQRLAGISMLCKSYSTRKETVKKDEMLELSQLIGDTLQTTRQYAHNSYPVELESLGLNKAIGNLCNSFEKQSGIRCRYNWKLSEINFSDIEALNVFRIIQEALHNVLKHSGASEVCVELENVGSKVTVFVRDDGKGLSGNVKKRGLGLDSMQYRANQIGADFSFISVIPHGTEVRMEFEPLQ